ncbi:DUF4118 domain-containing protein [Bradyrhizobium tropiciagri]|uniref:DUF4118 domain-containing protein n=1 Tax=Bradyrhizobium tropiciagri TaxID=312253 RepID=UPI001009E8E4
MVFARPCRPGIFDGVVLLVGSPRRIDRIRLLIVLLSLTGRFISLIALSFVAYGCLRHFFSPPIFDLRVHSLEDTITVTAFLITALVIACLVVRKDRTR